MAEDKETPVVIMEEHAAPGTSVKALKEMYATGRVETILDGDDLTKGGSGAFFLLKIRAAYQSLFGNLNRTNPPTK